MKNTARFLREFEAIINPTHTNPHQPRTAQKGTAMKNSSKTVSKNVKSAKVAIASAKKSTTVVGPLTGRKLNAKTGKPVTVKKTGNPGLVGKTTKLNKIAFIIQMLLANEKTHLADVMLATKLEREFPKTVQYPIVSLRSKLNRGGFGKVGFKSTCFKKVAA